MASVFNQNKVDFTKQLYVLWRNGMQRYDEFKYPVFDSTCKTVRFLLWPEEISLPERKAVTTIMN